MIRTFTHGAFQVPVIDIRGGRFRAPWGEAGFDSSMEAFVRWMHLAGAPQLPCADPYRTFFALSYCRYGDATVNIIAELDGEGLVRFSVRLEVPAGEEVATTGPVTDRMRTGFDALRALTVADLERTPDRCSARQALWRANGFEATVTCDPTTGDVVVFFERDRTPELLRSVPA